MKNRRQDKILELIDQYDIETQDNLIERLQAAGFAATQATISRDIRELKIAKMMSGQGTYRYALPKQHVENGPSLGFSNSLIDSIVSVDHACNLVVLKTYAGLAQAVAVGIDGMNMHQVLGCVAGDDTIMIVSRDEECATVIADRIRMLMKNL